MRKCCVPGCVSNHGRPYVPTFLFPKDEDRRKLWERNIGKQDIKITNNVGVCIKHFLDIYIIRHDTPPDEMQGRKKTVKLKREAVPSIFPEKVSEDLPVKRRRRRTISKGVRMKHPKLDNSPDQISPNDPSSPNVALAKEPATLKELLQKPCVTNRPIITIVKAEDVTEDDNIDFCTENEIEVLNETEENMDEESIMTESRASCNATTGSKQDDSVLVVKVKPSSMVRSLSIGSNSSNGSNETSKPILSPVAKRRKVEKPPPTVIGKQNDVFCWVCHKDPATVPCGGCKRAFHQRCAGDIEHSDDWMCIECEKLVRSDSMDNRSKTLTEMSMDKFCSLLKTCLNRLKCRAPTAFHQPVPVEYYRNYLDFVIHPMDLSLIEKKIKQLMYGSTEDFISDVKWIQHNSTVFNGAQHPLTVTARKLVRTAEADTSEIEICPDCYLHGAAKSNKYWFSDVCGKPHPIVWAKLKGFPYWPAKVVKIVGDSVDARFFGAHDRAWVPITQCYHLSKEMPTSSKPKKKQAYDVALEELEIHVKLLRQKYDRFIYAPYRTLFNPSNKMYTFHGIDINKILKKNISNGTAEDNHVYSAGSMPSVQKDASPEIEILEVKKSVIDEASRRLSQSSISSTFENSSSCLNDSNANNLDVRMEITEEGTAEESHEPAKIETKVEVIENSIQEPENGENESQHDVKIDELNPEKEENVLSKVLPNDEELEDNLNNDTTFKINEIESSNSNLEPSCDKPEQKKDLLSSFHSSELENFEKLESALERIKDFIFEGNMENKNTDSNSLLTLEKEDSDKNGEVIQNLCESNVNSGKSIENVSQNSHDSITCVRTPLENRNSTETLPNHHENKTLNNNEPSQSLTENKTLNSIAASQILHENRIPNISNLLLNTKSADENIRASDLATAASSTEINSKVDGKTETSLDATKSAEENASVMAASKKNDFFALKLGKTIESCKAKLGITDLSEEHSSSLSESGEDEEEDDDDDDEEDDDEEEDDDDSDDNEVSSDDDEEVEESSENSSNDESETEGTENKKSINGAAAEVSEKEEIDEQVNKSIEAVGVKSSDAVISEKLTGESLPVIENDLPLEQKEPEPEGQDESKNENSQIVSTQAESGKSTDSEMVIEAEIKSPVKPGIKSPVTPEIRSPVKPGIKSPVTPEIRSPVKPGMKSPVTPEISPSQLSPVKPDFKSPIELETSSPVKGLENVEDNSTDVIQTEEHIKEELSMLNEVSIIPNETVPPKVIDIIDLSDSEPEESEPPQVSTTQLNASSILNGVAQSSTKSPHTVDAMEVDEDAQVMSSESSMDIECIKSHTDSRLKSAIEENVKSDVTSEAHRKSQENPDEEMMEVDASPCDNVQERNPNLSAGSTNKIPTETLFSNEEASDLNKIPSPCPVTAKVFTVNKELHKVHSPVDRSDVVSSSVSSSKKQLVSEFKEESIDEKDMLRKEVKELKEELRLMKIKCKKQEMYYHQEQFASRHHTNNVAAEMRMSLETDKKAAVENLQQEFELEKAKAVEDIKGKQWCALCKTPAIFLCCWSASYCSHFCQNQHWSQHRPTCTQVKMPPQQPLMAKASATEYIKIAKKPTTSEAVETNHLDKKVYFLNMKQPDSITSTAISQPNSIPKTSLQNSLQKVQFVTTTSQFQKMASTAVTSNVITPLSLLPKPPVQIVLASVPQQTKVVQDSADIITKVRSRQTDLNTAIQLLNRMNKETEETLKKKEQEELPSEEVNNSQLKTDPSVSPYHVVNVKSAEKSEPVSEDEDDDDGFDEVLIIDEKDTGGALFKLNYGVEISKKKLMHCVNTATNATRLARSLMEVLFPDSKMLAESSVFGRKSNVTKKTRPALKLEVVNAILDFVMSVYPSAQKSDLVLAMNLKCKEARRTVVKTQTEAGEETSLKRKAEMDEFIPSKIPKRSPTIVVSSTKTSPIKAVSISSITAASLPCVIPPISKCGTTSIRALIPRAITTPLQFTSPTKAFAVRGTGHLIACSTNLNNVSRFSSNIAIRPKPTIVAIDNNGNKLKLVQNVFQVASKPATSETVKPSSVDTEHEVSPVSANAETKNDSNDGTLKASDAKESTVPLTNPTDGNQQSILTVGQPVTTESEDSASSQQVAISNAKEESSSVASS